jgi:signal transduction histidine kinase
MVERARLAGGELDVRSAPGGGTTVTLRIARVEKVAS